MDKQPETGLLRERHTLALLSGDQREVSRVARDTLDRGIERAAIFLEILGPALVEVGDAWVRGELNVADEHLAISFTLQQIGHLRDVSRRKAELGATVGVAAVEEEL